MGLKWKLEWEDQSESESESEFESEFESESSMELPERKNRESRIKKSVLASRQSRPPKVATK